MQTALTVFFTFAAIVAFAKLANDAREIIRRDGAFKALIAARRNGSK